MIRLRQVDVAFPREGRRRRRLPGSLSGWLTGRDVQPTVQALQNINLEIRAGERVGLVGGNGAGKSTLLRVLAGVYNPTRGEVAVAGEVAALLSLQHGFRGDLTGRENILLSGLLHGRPGAQMRALAAEIIDFSGLGEAIDRPVQCYSTGMSARLGFAISTAIAPAVLLIDEMLGVGDGAFRKRCDRRLDELISDARVLVLCSHNLTLVRKRCTRVIWLEAGQIVRDGEPEAVLEEYREKLVA